MSQIIPEELQFSLAGGRNPLILLPVYVEEKGPFQFILDTGASLCLISSELASTLGIQAESEKQARGAGGEIKVGLGHVRSMEAGPARQENVQVAITNEVERFGAAIQTKVDGNLGFNFLKHFRLTLDYRRNALRFRPSLYSQEANGLHPGAVGFTLGTGSKPLILLQALVDGHGPFQFALDTGASLTVLAPETARGLNLLESEACMGAGAGGKMQMTLAKVNSLTVGDVTVYDLNIVIGAFLEMIGAAVGTKLDGIVGYNFLNQCQVTIDYPQRQLELTLIANG